MQEFGITPAQANQYQWHVNWVATKGHRVKAVSGATSTTYIGNYLEWTGSTSTMVKYYYAGSARVAERQGSVLSYLLADHLGSTAITADSSGSKIAELRYKAWGETRYSSGTTPTNRRFTGQTQDSYINLYWMGSRWYDPALGRWIQPDSIVPEVVQGVQAWDRYAYVNNSPIYYTDPSGHMASACGVDGSECGDADQRDWNYFNARYNQQQCDSGQLEGCNSVGNVLAFTAVGLATAGVGQTAIEAAAVPILEAGTTAAGSACADGDCFNEIIAVQKGITVIGRYPAYVNTAKDVGGKIFSVPVDIWNNLNPAEQWALNKQFLDAAMVRGDTFYLAGRWVDATVGSFFRMELEYLFSHGYTLSLYQNYLLPPSQ